MNTLSKAGVALMIAAFAVLTFFIILPSVIPIDTTPWLHGPYQALFCHGGETLSSDSETYRPSPGETDTTVTTGCIDSQGNARDVSGDIIKIGMIGYLAPFLIGLFMFTTGQNQKRKLAQTSYAPTYNGNLGADSRTINRNGMNITVNKEGDYVARTPDGRTVTDDPVDNSSTLDRLKTLKTAYEQGLITQSEYESKRAALLKDM